MGVVVNEKYARQLFGVCMVAASISALAMSPIFWVTGPLAVAAFVHWQFRKPRPYYGLLSHEKRPPLEKKERTSLIAGNITNMKALQQHIGNQQPIGPRQVAQQQALKIFERYTGPRDGRVLSDDELRSQFQLMMYGLDVATSDAEPNPRWLEDVADPTPFLELKAAVEAAKAKQRGTRNAHGEWLAHVGGNTDANHLLKDGMLAFLQSMPGKDIGLWQMVVVETHELERNIDAAFWICEQPECDRLTAQSLIAFLLEDDVLSVTLGHAKGERRQELDRKFRALISRWNSGFHSRRILPGPERTDGTFSGFGQENYIAVLAEIARAHGLPPYETPIGLNDAPAPADPGADPRYRSPYDYWYDEGLHLNYPGPSWRSRIQA